MFISCLQLSVSLLVMMTVKCVVVVRAVVCQLSMTLTYATVTQTAMNMETAVLMCLMLKIA